MKTAAHLFSFLCFWIFSSSIFAQDLILPTSPKQFREWSGQKEFAQFAQYVQMDFEMIVGLNLEAFKLWDKLLLNAQGNLAELIEDIENTSLNETSEKELKSYYAKVHSVLSSSTIEVSGALSDEAKNTFPELHPLLVQVLVGILAQVEGVESSEYRSVYSSMTRELASFRIAQSLRHTPIHNALTLLALNFRSKSLRFGLDPGQAFAFTQVFHAVLLDLRGMELAKNRPNSSEILHAQTKLIEYQRLVTNWRDCPEIVEVTKAQDKEYRETIRSEVQNGRIPDLLLLMDGVEKKIEEAKVAYLKRKYQEYQPYMLLLEAYHNPVPPEKKMALLWALKQFSLASMPLIGLSDDLYYLNPKNRIEMIEKMRALYRHYSH